MKLTDKECDAAIKRVWPYYGPTKDITYEREIYRAGILAGVETLRKLLAVTESMADAVHVTRTDRQVINEAKRLLRKITP